MILDKVREAAAKRILFPPHAITQMSRPERMISTEEVRRVINMCEVIEDYPEDKRGHSCLILGYGNGGKAIHIVCTPKEDYLAIITAYLPTLTEWSDDFRERRKQ